MVVRVGVGVGVRVCRGFPLVVICMYEYKMWFMYQPRQEKIALAITNREIINYNLNKNLDGIPLYSTSI